MPQEHAGDRDRRGGPLFDLTPLRHPLWWAALALLLVNDNLLKGGGLVPGWLTGKLSDVAFLVVAPVLLTVLLPTRVRGRRGLAFLLVVGMYTLADLSAVASDAIVAFAATLGFRWRLWPDVTDLLALLVLPGSWWLAGQSRVCLLPGRRVLEAAGVCLGAAACLATSDDSVSYYPFVVNQTDDPQTLTLTWVLKKVPCDADLPALAAALTVDDLAEPHVELLGSGQPAALDSVPAAGTQLAGICVTSGPSMGTVEERCSTLIVSVAGGPALLASARRKRWVSGSGQMFSCGRSTPEPRCEPMMDIKGAAGPDGLSVQLEGGVLVFKAGESWRTVPIDLPELMARPGDGSGCRTRRERVTALFENAKACSVADDCQVVQANIDIPGEPLCNVYVSRALSGAAIAEARSGWNAHCQSGSTYSCGGGMAQPPVCRAGRCEPACPGENLPSCWPDCSAHGATRGGSCAGEEGSVCYASELERCRCGGGPPTWSCQVAPFSPTCPLACASYPVVSATPDAGLGGRVDSGVGEAGASPVDATAVDR